MKLKNLVLALGLVAASSANATTTAVGTVGVGMPSPFSGFAAAGHPFSDNFTFDLPTNGGTGYSVINFPLSIPGSTFNTLLTTMSLFSNADGILFNGDDVLLSSTSGSPDSLGLTWGASAAGSYYLNISGVTNGSLGGLYNGAISVTAIPEPEVWAMLVAGIGLVGLQLRRRSGAGKITAI